VSLQATRWPLRSLTKAPMERGRLTRAKRAPAGKLQAQEKAHMLAKGLRNTDTAGRTNAEQP